MNKATFSELSFKERDHLQEWIAASPDCLGEELLIIQKEFDGFSETRERLDLLALDKQGGLVVIENKLDDTGRDVVWQALKYAAYCSTLKTAQIVDIFGQFLKCSRAEAEETILDFLEEDSFDEVSLNKGNEQRIFLIAANFRKEVTATALWLLAHGIDMRCFRVTPFRLPTEILLNFEQIIPPPEAEDYMIGISAKEAEASESERTEKRRHQLRREFWTQCLDALRNSSVRLYDNISPHTDHWSYAGSGVSGCPYELIFGKAEARVGVNLARSDRDENKRLFDYLYERREEIEGSFGTALTWKRLDAKKSSRVEFAKAFEGFDKTAWPEMIGWIIEHIRRLENAIGMHLKDAASKTLRQTGHIPPAKTAPMLDADVN